MAPINPFSPDQLQTPSVFQPTTPDAGMFQQQAASPVPSVFSTPKPLPSVFKPLQDEEDVAQQRLQKDQWKDANPFGSANNHPGVIGKIAHGLSLAGNIAGDIFAPAVMANIPGTDAHRMVEEEGLNREVQGLEHQKVANAKEQADADRSLQEQQMANDEEPGKLQAQEDEHELKGAQTAKELTPAEKGIDNQTYDFLTKRLGMTPQEAYKEMQQEKGEPGRELREQAMNQTEQLRRDQMKQNAQFHAEHEQDLAESRAQRAAEFGAKANKPTADEQKKADLVDNLNENLGVVEEIAQRRPDLFGPVAGRMTQLKNSLGTSDPDIAALEAAQHQLGMVQQGVHGMRSATGLKSAVDSLMNGFHNSPEAMRAAINTARNSAKTFTNAVGEKGEPGIGGVPQKMIFARDPQGKLHQAPAGTELPAGWKAENGR